MTSMAVITPDQFAHFTGLFLVCVFVVSFLASAVGIWFARASYDWMFCYVSRLPRWRRFDRAVRRYFA